MRKGFTADISTLQFPKTANILANKIRNHFGTEPTGKPKALAELSPFITLWSTKRDVEDEIVRLHRAEDGSIKESGLRESHRLYAIDGTKLGLLKVKVIRIQEVFDSAGLDDDGSHDNEYLVWSEIPKIAVVEEVHYDEIKQKRWNELNPPELDEEQESDGGEGKETAEWLELSCADAQLTAIGSNAAANQPNTTTRRNSKVHQGHQPRPEREELRDNEFRVAAVIDHWPYEWTQPHAQQYLLRWKEGVDEDSWSGRRHVHDDLLDEYWARKGLENREIALAKKAAEKEGAEMESEGEDDKE